MKRCILLILILALLTGCAMVGPIVPEQEPLEITYALDKQSYKKGETIQVNVLATNTGSDILYYGQIYYYGAVCSETTEKKIATDQLKYTNWDENEYVFEKGATYETCLIFKLPEDINAGCYDLEVKIQNHTALFPGVIEIVE